MLALRIVLTIAGLSAVSAALTNSNYERKFELTRLGNSGGHEIKNQGFQNVELTGLGELKDGKSSPLLTNSQRKVTQIMDEGKTKIGIQGQVNELRGASAAAGLAIKDTANQSPMLIEFNSSRSKNIRSPCSTWKVASYANRYVDKWDLLASTSDLADPASYTQTVADTSANTAVFLDEITKVAAGCTVVEAITITDATFTLSSAVTANASDLGNTVPGCNGDIKCEQLAVSAYVKKNEAAGFRFFGSLPCPA